jgi:hypothetical protein
MGYNKNFVVKNGLEVGGNLIYANADSSRIGIGTTVPQYNLDISGSLRSNFATLGISTVQNLILSGGISIGSSSGSAGQYIVNTGTGVTWQNLPNFRSTSTQVATAAQVVFSFTYTIGLVDVYVNGVKLSSSEYTAADGITVTLGQPCFGGEIVELIGYSTVNPGYAFTGINGITTKNAGVTTGTSGGVTSINFVGTVGAGVSVTGTGIGATVTISNAKTIAFTVAFGS